MPHPPRFFGRRGCRGCAERCVYLYIYIFLISIPSTILALLVLLPPCRNSDPGSHSRLFSPLLTRISRVVGYMPSIFVSRRVPRFLPSSTHILKGLGEVFRKPPASLCVPPSIGLEKLCSQNFCPGGVVAFNLVLTVNIVRIRYTQAVQTAPNDDHPIPSLCILKTPLLALSSI